MNICIFSNLVDWICGIAFVVVVVVFIFHFLFYFYISFLVNLFFRFLRLISLVLVTLVEISLNH